MKTKNIIFSLLLILLVGFSIHYWSPNGSNANQSTKKRTLKEVKDGDVIFQTSQSSQCEAVRIATNSKYSHCGIIFVKDQKKYVLEAVQPVKITPLEQWIQHGKAHCYVVKRLKDTLVLNNDKLTAMKLAGKKMLARNYDLTFEWSDDKIYCSELVWKIYKRGAGIELCPLQKLKNFNLKHPQVKKIMNERYGNAIPYNEEVVAPSQIANSSKMETIIDTYTF